MRQSTKEEMEMHTDNTLIEPELTVHDMGGQTVRFTTNATVAALLREEAGKELTEPLAELSAASRGPDLSWRGIEDLRASVNAAAEALTVLRATTANPDDDDV